MSCSCRLRTTCRGHSPPRRVTTASIDSSDARDDLFGKVFDGRFLDGERRSEIAGDDLGRHPRGAHQTGDTRVLELPDDAWGEDGADGGENGERLGGPGCFGSLLQHPLHPAKKLV